MNHIDLLTMDDPGKILGVTKGVYMVLKSPIEHSATVSTPLHYFFNSNCHCVHYTTFRTK